MDTNKKIARMVGVLYIMGTVAGILSVVATHPLFDASDYLAEISAHETRLATGTLCVLLMGLFLALIPIVAFPVLKRHDETLAVGYVVFRGALETATNIVLAILWLTLVPISHDYARAGAASSYHTVGTLLKTMSESAGILLSIVFSLGALIFYSLLYRSKLIPRWISGWGLVAVVFYMAGALLAMFGVIEPSSSAESMLDGPMFLQEMVMAVWLIVKGFDPAAIRVATPVETR